MKNGKLRIVGTTLVEVTVASFLLFTISGTIALALSTVFDGYLITQQGSSIEQDAQLILSRMRFASGKHDDAVLLSHAKREDFTKEGSVFVGTELSSTTKNNIRLKDGVLQGAYTSQIQSFSDPQTIKKLMFIGNSSTTSATLKLQLAAFQKTGGVCDPNNVDFVGPDKTQNTFFEGITNEVSESLAGVFRNPAECVRYKMFLERENTNIETPKVFEVRLEK